MARNEFQCPEPCPALKGWKNCVYAFGDSVTSSWIEKWCLGDYKTCGRYQEHAQTSTKCTADQKLHSCGKETKMSPLEIDD